MMLQAGFGNPVNKAADFVFERMPGLNYFAGIIMCKGQKVGA